MLNSVVFWCKSLDKGQDLSRLSPLGMSMFRFYERAAPYVHLNELFLSEAFMLTLHFAYKIDRDNSVKKNSYKYVGKWMAIYLTILQIEPFHHVKKPCSCIAINTSLTLTTIVHLAYLYPS